MYVQQLTDPLEVDDGFQIKKESTLYSFDFRASSLAYSGISKVKLNYLKAVRHCALSMRKRSLKHIRSLTCIIPIVSEDGMLNAT